LRGGWGVRQPPVVQAQVRVHVALQEAMHRGWGEGGMRRVARMAPGVRSTCRAATHAVCVVIKFKFKTNQIKTLRAQWIIH
jgi:hypothetical protein